MAATAKTLSTNASRDLRLSFNFNLINKIAPQNKRHFTEGFEPYQVPLSSLVDAVSTGVAFSYEFENDIRKKDNFKAADVLCADMDGGRTIQDALNDPIVKSFGSFYYTTPSHSADQHRFRIIFILPRTITDPNELQSAMRALARRLGGDRTVTDPARMFFGSTDCQHRILGNSLTDEYLAELIKDGRVETHSESITGTPTTSRSDLRLQGSDIIKLHDGSLVELRKIASKTSVHCPGHNDKNASAFVALSKNRSRYLHCSKCRLTWWEDSVSSSYNFNEFETAVVKLKKLTSTKQINTFEVGIEKFAQPRSSDKIEFQNVEIQNQKYLSLPVLPDGLTFVKSPKGSGKSTILADHVERYIKIAYPMDPEEPDKVEYSLEEYEIASGDEDLPIFHPNRSVLLIGHRRALIGNLCKSFGINNYMKDTHCKNSTSMLL